MSEQRTGYLGTYFDKDLILLLVKVARVFSWVVVVFYAIQWFVQFGVDLLSILRGFWVGLGFTDYAMNLIVLFEQPLRGVVYFIVLQAVAQVLLLFMDIEDNTRRISRETAQKEK